MTISEHFEWNKRGAIAALILIILGTGFLLVQQGQSTNLSIEDRSTLNEARFQVANAALDLQALQPYIRQAQETKARYDAALKHLQALEEEMSKKYTDGRLRLDENLEFVPIPVAPEAAQDSQSDQKADQKKE